MNRAKDWLKQAELDFEAAKDSARLGHHEWAAFQAQPCAEKAAKALVQSLHGAVRGHAVTEILELLPSSVTAPQEVLEAARELDRIYLTSRCPNGFATGSPADYLSRTSSERYLGCGAAVLEFCRSQIH